MRGSKAIAIIAALALSPLAGHGAAPTHLVEEQVVSHKKLEDGTILLDFGKVAFGNLKWTPPVNPNGLHGDLVWHFGESLKDGRIDRKPPGTVRYAIAKTNGEPQVVAPPADGRNTSHPSAVKLPAEYGVLLPFRWVEIEGWKREFKPEWVVRQSAYLRAWDEAAADFECSDETLNRIWDLCKYSIKATTFAGVYVDGDRERIPYEADAYLNQLSHYYCDADKQIARETFDYLMEKPTWPTEWAPHMVFMAHADWKFTGDAEWLKPRYQALLGKLLMGRQDEAGWIRSDDQARGKVKGFKGLRDIVDWPLKERDGYVFTEVNTVVNAFHLQALKKMADLAEAVGKPDEAQSYRRLAAAGSQQFHKALWMAGKGCYRDGIGTDHASAHATFFPLAFGLVPEKDRAAAIQFLKTRGMACSVYAAQYLMEGLFENGAGDYAVQLMLADGDRSWKHMLHSGTTITWEAWDQKYKPNQDWNHAWGAAPGNLLPRYVLGVEPLEPGFKTFRIAPQTAGLTHAKGKVPTPHGPIEVSWKIEGGKCILEFSFPEGTAPEVTMGPGWQNLVQERLKRPENLFRHEYRKVD